MGPTLAAFEPIHDLPAPSETWRGCSEYDIYQYFDLVTDTVDVSCFEWSNYLPTAGDDISECFSLMCKHVVFYSNQCRDCTIFFPIKNYVVPGEICW